VTTQQESDHDLVHEQDRHQTGAYNLMCCAAKESLSPGTMAIAPHDQKIRAIITRGFE
jgi:hypothetical protein